MGQSAMEHSRQGEGSLSQALIDVCPGKNEDQRL